MSTTNVKIINKSKDNYLFNIVVFQKNKNRAVAYRVLKNLGKNAATFFAFDGDLSLSVEDSWGNYTMPITVKAGGAFEYIGADGHFTLRRSNISNPNSYISLKNKLSQGAIKVRILRGQYTVALSRPIVPEQKAIFDIDSTIYLNIDNNKSIKEGDKLTSEFINETKSKFLLNGVTNIEIDMQEAKKGGEISFKKDLRS